MPRSRASLDHREQRRTKMNKDKVHKKKFEKLKESVSKVTRLLKDMDVTSKSKAAKLLKRILHPHAGTKHLRKHGERKVRPKKTKKDHKSLPDHEDKSPVGKKGKAARSTESDEVSSEDSGGESDF